MTSILTTRDVAAILGVCEHTVYRYLSDRKLAEPQRIGAMRVWTPQDVSRALAALDPKPSSVGAAEHP